MSPAGPFDLVAAMSREEAPLRFLRDLFLALQVLRLRGAEDAKAQEAIESFHQSLQAMTSSGAVRIQRSGPHLFLNESKVRPSPDVRLQVRALGQDLDRFGIGGFEFGPGVTRDGLSQFLDLYANLEQALAEAGAMEEVSDGRGKQRDRLTEVVELVPAISALPDDVQFAEEEEGGGDRQNQARRTFFRALKAARLVFKQSQANRIPELRKTRAVVHEMIDAVVEEEFSLLGISAMHNFDEYTFQHSVHVAVLSVALGQKLGLPRTELSHLGVSAMFHDVGKTRIPKKVLWKPGSFDKNDWTLMQKHPLAGAREMLRYGGMSDLAVRAMLVSAEHHMRFDGSGYPDLGRGWQQGLFSRIVALADCFDAMTASRVYMERPFTPDAVVRYMIENSGRMFDPDLLRDFIGVIGVFPVGSMVRLQSGELALVTEAPTGVKEIERPRCRLLVETARGHTLGEERNLADGPAVDPRFRVRASCHPMDFSIDVDELLSGQYMPEPTAAAA